MLFTLSPFYHSNSANFDGETAIDHHRSRYIGAQATYETVGNLRIGAFGFHQNDDVRFGLRPTAQRETPSGDVGVVFAEDRFDIGDVLTLRGGVRVTRFTGGVHETATSPRAGLTIRIPRSNVVVRASYGDYYQAPPLLTVSGPLLQLALEQGFEFLPLHGERDHQAEIGVAVPFRHWTFDAAALWIWWVAF